MLPSSVFSIQSLEDFKSCALKTFLHQAEHCSVYRSYIQHIGVDAKDVIRIDEIPFLPISFFKSESIICNNQKPELTFASSGTTGSQKSRHYVADAGLYEASFLHGFERFYGSPKDYHIIALLPNYLEQGASSLVYMVDGLIKESGSTESGFYLNQLDELSKKLKHLDNSGKKVLLIGVSYALLDLTENQTFSLKNTTILETGGMKGRRKELLKPQLHAILRKGFGVEHIHSEYGMTELLSQAYSKKHQRFATPPWMKVLLREPNDPFSYVPHGQTGGLNVIDLANYHSCSFIATQDLGKMHSDDSFEILGRFDHSDLRGCNLLVQ